MPKKPEDIKKQKEKELEKKRKALEKRRQEKLKADPEFQKQASLQRKQRSEMKISVFTERLADSRLCFPALIIICFSLMCLICYCGGYRIFSPDFKVSGIFHCLYLGDYSIGLSSRLLVGSIISLFTDVITADSINIFAKTALYAALLLQAVLSSAVLKKGIKEKNIFILLFAVVFVVNPVTVCTYTFYFGTLDLYNYIVFLIAVAIIVKGKAELQLAVPVLGIAGLLIHYSFFFAFFPALFVLGLYRTVNAAPKKTAVEAAALGINSAASIGVFFWLSVFAKNFMKMTSEEMLSYVKSKTDPESVYVFEDYLEYYIFDIYKGSQMPDTKASLTELIKINMGLTAPSVYIKYFLFISIPLILFWIIWICLIRKEKGKRKLPFIAAFVMPFALVPELILSSDVWRWIGSTMLCQFVTLFAFYIMKVPSVIELFEASGKKKRLVKAAFIVVVAAYIIGGFFFEHSLYR